ncbi:AMP-binding protein [Pseudonocardia sp. NPDC049635]|uniref:class I adenylate-forming enzyme family protein n=1 Tax=Pseudonocardia sp. NPDC049635 TaxID=3155506 RepID=UPI00340CD037
MTQPTGATRQVGAGPIISPARLPPELADVTDLAAARLRVRGIGPGDRVVIDAPGRARWDALPYLLAVDRVGAATLIADPGWSDRERASVLADAAPDAVLRTDAGDRPGSTAAAGTTGRGGHHAPEPGSTPVTDPTAPFLLPTTSGSTGPPTVLARTRDSWLIGFDALGPLPGPVLVPGPPSSTLYLFGALHALHHGRRLVTTDRFDPADLPDGGTVHLVPALLSSLLDDRERRPGRPAPAVVVCGGAHLAPTLRERCARLLPGTVLIEYYGSAEHSLIALRHDAGPLRAVPGVELAVHDDVLWVDSPQTVLGRLRDGVLRPIGPGPSTVGDRARLDPDGTLTVHGRAATTITSGATLVAAEEVEQVLRAVPGVADVVVAGTPHPALGMLVTAVVELRDGVPPSRRELRAAAREALSPAKRPRRWLLVPALPRLGSGKPARALVHAGLRDGTLDAQPFPLSDDVRPGVGR